MEIVEITPASARTMAPMWIHRRGRTERVIDGAQLGYLEDRRSPALDSIMDGFRWKDFVA